MSCYYAMKDQSLCELLYHVAYYSIDDTFILIKPVPSKTKRKGRMNPHEHMPSTK
jgi:hypothetical protein